MGLLARGGHAPVLITFMMGTSALIIGIMIILKWASPLIRYSMLDAIGLFCEFLERFR